MLVREYFPDTELRCHCGCGLLPPVSSVERLYALRILMHQALPISSAARCRKHNLAIKGGIGSIHLPIENRRGFSKDWGGGAFDILADHDLQIWIISNALKCGFTGYGLAETYIHIDDAARPNRTYWTYK